MELISDPTPATAAGNDGRSILVEGVSRRFGDTVALHPLDLAIAPTGPGSRGGVIGLLGPNGSGKSTLMRILTGLVRPDTGSARVAGVPLRGDGTAIRERVTYAPGELHLYDEMRAAEHLRWLLRRRPREAVARAFELASELGLPLRRRVRGFSHGMKRQLLLAAALGPRVPIRILDEPTEGLDPSRRGEVLDLLEADAATGTMILLSSHHLEEASRVCDRFLFLSQGRLLEDLAAPALRERASRILRLRFETPIEEVEDRLRLPDVESVRSEGPVVAVTLSTSDPRRFLAALAEARELPPPSSIEHGQLSLRILYRELYGVEGC